jgi:4-amino-4-deoxy-L-arabinose transferase-like glycosyltransferase
LGIVVALATALSTTLLIVHSMVWSEPLFIALRLGAMLLLSDALDSFQSERGTDRIWSLSLAGILIGIAAITRYAGVAFIGAAASLILIQKRQALRERLVRAIVFVAISAIPLMCWVTYNRGRGTTGTNRELAYHPVPGRELAEVAKPMGHWFVPVLDWRPFQFVALLLCLVPLLAVTLTVVRFGTRTRLNDSRATALSAHDELASRPSASLATICSVLPVWYIAFLLVSKTFVDRAIDLDDRLLSPILPPIIALIASSVALLFRDPPVRSRARWNVIRTTVIVSVGLYFVSQAMGSTRYLRRTHELGVGVEVTARSAPALLQLSRELPTGARIYSNAPYVIFGITGRMVRGLPPRRSSTSLRPNPRFETEVGEMGGGDGGHTYVLYFGAGDDGELVTARELEQRFPLAEARAVPGGLFMDVQRSR